MHNCLFLKKQLHQFNLHLNVYLWKLNLSESDIFLRATVWCSVMQFKITLYMVQTQLSVE